MSGTKRWIILSDLIKKNYYKIGAEIGVMSGRNVKEVLERCPDFFFYAVDPWVPTENYSRWPPSSHKMHERRFHEWTYHLSDRIQKMKMFSHEAAPLIEDKSLDLVFIDGDHSYEGVRLDIDLWLPKIRPGGIISGHDYDNTNKYGDAFKGVDRAVHETFGNDFTLETDHVWWSWVL